MSFNVILQKNNSDYNVINKEIENIITLTGDLKNNSSLIDPTFIVRVNVDMLVNSNYLTVEKFKRKYFIQDIKSLTNGTCEITAHVDVLSSFSNDIKECVGIVNKQENEWNLYLDDGTFKAYQNSNVLTKEFPSGFTNYNFLLAVAGR